MAKTATVDVVMNLSALRSQFTEVSRSLQRSLEAATANVDRGLDLDGQLNSELGQVQFQLRGIAVEAERVARSMSTISADGIDLDADASGVLDAIRLAQTSVDSLAFEEQVKLIADASGVLDGAAIARSRLDSLPAHLGGPQCGAHEGPPTTTPLGCLPTPPNPRKNLAP